jgi:hypothetical protein
MPLGAESGHPINARPGEEAHPVTLPLTDQLVQLMPSLRRLLPRVCQLPAAGTMDSSIRHGAITSATELAPSLQEGNAKEPRGLSIRRSAPEVRLVGARPKQRRRALALDDAHASRASRPGLMLRPNEASVVRGQTRRSRFVPSASR